MGSENRSVGHPNDPAGVRAHLLNEVSVLTPRERAEILAHIDAALERLDEPSERERGCTEPA